MLTYLFRCIFLLLCIAAATSGYAGDKLLLHRLQKGSTVANVLRRLELKPLFGKNSYVSKTLSLNPHITRIGETELPTGTVIILPIRKLPQSQFWFVSDQYVYFNNIERVPTETLEKDINENRWLAELNLGTGFLDTHLEDTLGLSANVSTQSSLNHSVALIYKKQSSYWYQFRYRSEDRSYSTSSTLDVSHKKIRRESYELKAKYNLTPKSRLGWSIGLADGVSFLTDNINSVGLLTGQREFFSLNADHSIPLKQLDVLLEAQVSFSPEVTYGNIDFENAFKISVKASSFVELNKKTDFIFGIEAFYVLEDAQTYDQNTQGTLFDIGIRWEL